MMAFGLPFGLDASSRATLTYSRKKRFAGCAILSLLPLLGGCVALPVIAGAAMVAGRERVTVRAATPVPAPPATAVASEVPEGEQYVVQRHLTELPPPVAVTEVWEPFVSYALERRNVPEGDSSQQSAILAPLTSLDQPRRRPCIASTPAVVVDLDEGPATFSAEQPVSPAPGLASAISRLRAAGIVILWISQADANQVTQVANALRTSGLDPAGQDPLLLVRNEQDRKQVMREQANEDVCIFAIAGDQRSDFDELFNYLLDPDYGDFLLSLLEGKGWFVVPTPLASVHDRLE